MAASVGTIPQDDMLHRGQLREAVEALHQALTKP
jgi:hypothetical protein